MARTKEFDTHDVLDKAVHLFWCKGYNGASMQEVVDELDLSRSSIYDTFGDKHQLYIEALKKYRRDMTGLVVETLRASADAKAGIKAIFDSNIHACLNDHANKGCFMVNSAVELGPHDPEIAALVKQNMHDMEAAFAETIERGQAAGQIASTHDAKALARFLFNNITGMWVASKSGIDKQGLEDIMHIALSVI
ncbi:MAG: TetR/AcrR family transcriptional regulator [Bacteroidota bacterium]